MTSEEFDQAAFERQLRQGLAAAAELADSSAGPAPIAGRARRRNRIATGVGTVGALAVLVAVALAVLPDRSAPVLLGPVPTVGVSEPTATTAPVPSDLPTEIVPSTILPGGSDPVTVRPEAQLIAAIDGQLVRTDLDGRVIDEVAWQPSTQSPIAEVVTDGEVVVTWQPPCTLEAGNLIHGGRIALSTGGACDSSAAIDPQSGTIMWLTGPEAEAPGEERSVATYERTDGVVGAGETNAPDLLEPDDRVVGVDQLNGVTRLLIRRTMANWVEVLALPLERTDDGAWQSGGATADFDAAFPHVDGHVPLDAASDWLLDAAYRFPDGDRSPGVVEQVRVRPAGAASSSTASGGTPVDPTTVWFDASATATIWGHGDGSDPRWYVPVTNGDTTIGFTGMTSGGVTAAALLPDTIEIVDQPPAPAPTAPPQLIDPTWAEPWCGEVPMIGVATSADPDGEPLALCQDGRTPPFVGGGFGWTHPSINAGGVALAAAASQGLPPVITVRGSQGINREDITTPALSPAGGIGWTTRSLDATTIRTAESVAGMDAPVGQYELSGDLDVTHLSWARDSRFLFVTTRSGTGEVQAWVIDTTVPLAVDQAPAPDPRLLPIAPGDGEQVLAVAGELDTIGAGVLLTRDQAGTVRIVGVLVAEGSDPFPAPRLATLATIDGEVAAALTAERASPTIAATGTLTPDAEGAWDQGSTIAWLLADGQQVWHAPAGESPTPYLDGVAEIAIWPPQP